MFLDFVLVGPSGIELDRAPDLRIANNHLIQRAFCLDESRDPAKVDHPSQM